MQDIEEQGRISEFAADHIYPVHHNFMDITTKGRQKTDKTQRIPSSLKLLKVCKQVIFLCTEKVSQHKKIICLHTHTQKKNNHLKAHKGHRTGHHKKHSQKKSLFYSNQDDG